MLKLLYQKEEDIETKDGLVTLKEPFNQKEFLVPSGARTVKAFSE
jgi:hypothetical protein